LKKAIVREEDIFVTGFLRAVPDGVVDPEIIFFTDEA
jgi:hypothetical protein